jgi:hypothetical protein
VQNQEEVPSITGDVVPEYVSSFSQYKNEIIGKYSLDLAAAGANPIILHREWVNSRGVIFRFDRKAIEVRVMDEQECIKSDVASSCLIRALLRGLLDENTRLLAHETLVKDFNSIVSNGLEAQVCHPHGQVARQIWRHFLRIAWDNATHEEKKFLPIIQKRIERGNLSEIIRERVRRASQKTDLKEAIIKVYTKLAKSLMDNRPYF